VKFLDRLVTALFGLEDNEAEASGPTGVTVGGHRSANNVVLLELVLKGSVGHFPGQTTDKCLDLWWWCVVYDWSRLVVRCRCRVLSWSWGALSWRVFYWCFSVHSVSFFFSSLSLSLSVCCS